MTSIVATTEQLGTRVFTCDACGAQRPAGARGPLPRRCADCRSSNPRLLRYHLRQAKSLANGLGSDAKLYLMQATEVVEREWTRYGE